VVARQVDLVSLASDAPPAVIAAAPGVRGYSAVAYAGGPGLVFALYDELGDAGYEVYGRLLAPDGSLTAPQKVSNLGGAEASGPLAVASDGLDWLAVWTRHGANGDEVRGVQITDAGARLGANLSLSPTTGQIQGLIFDGTQYVAAWRSVWDAGEQFYLTPEPSDYSAPDAAYGPAAAPQGDLAISAAGGAWIFGWYDSAQGTVGLMRLSPSNGQLLGGTPHALQPVPAAAVTTSFLAIAGAGDHFLTLFPGADGGVFGLDGFTDGGWGPASLLGECTRASAIALTPRRTLVAAETLDGGIEAWLVSGLLDGSPCQAPDECSSRVCDLDAGVCAPPADGGADAGAQDAGTDAGDGGADAGSGRPGERALDVGCGCAPVLVGAGWVAWVPGLAFALALRRSARR